MDAADIDTIRTILADHGIDDMLTGSEFEELASKLETRESMMVQDLGLRNIYRKGLDSIINQY